MLCNRLTKMVLHILVLHILVLHILVLHIHIMVLHILVLHIHILVLHILVPAPLFFFPVINNYPWTCCKTKTCSGA